MKTSEMKNVDEIFAVIANRGGDAYFGEPVTQLEHALQTAALAVEAGVPDSLVVAALLHDFGHLLHGLPETVAGDGIDTRHEELGARRLRKYFGPEVSEPVRLHVASKRYLCAMEPAYFGQLSPASVESLRLQGGPMSAGEVAAFEDNPYFADGVRLRRWDDLAKIPGLPVPDLESYRGRVEAVLASGVKTPASERTV
jgi:phosphonate degradation associated HDIG domain protein